jgi:ribosome-associated protein
MRTAPESALRGTAPSERVSKETSSSALVDQITFWLDEAKAEDIVSIELAGKSSIADHMMIASGRTDRHVGAIADQLQRHLKEAGCAKVRVEGMQTCDWVLIDTGDIIIHLFRPEVRDFYNLEKMWSGDRPAEQPAH